MFRPFGFLIALTVAAPAFPQTPAPAAPPVTAGFDNGFFVGTADNRITLGTVVQVDGRFSVDDPLPITNTFTIRKARLILGGRIARYFEFRVMPDFGNGTAVVQDAWFDTRFSNAFRVRVGKDKTPLGYELLIGDGNLFFPERSLASSLVPNRDVGVQVQGDVAGGKVTYSGGVVNGVADSTSSSTDVDGNSDKDVAGRILLQPWRRGQNPGIASGLGFHLGGSVGDQTGALPSFRTSVGQTYFAYATGTAAAGRRTRVTPAAFYFYKPFGAFGEYVLSTQEIARAGVTQKVDNHAVNVTTALFLTGEAAGTGTTRPRRPFDPAAGQWGALQVVARYSHLELDGDIFSNGFAAAGASRRADQWTAGLNWFPTAFTKWYVNYEHTTFDEGVPSSRPVENVIVFRGQLAF
jgi:phosphate-selective porin OprO and OprP